MVRLEQMCPQGTPGQARPLGVHPNSEAWKEPGSQGRREKQPDRGPLSTHPGSAKQQLNKYNDQLGGQSLSTAGNPDVQRGARGGRAGRRQPLSQAHVPTCGVELTKACCSQRHRRTQEEGLPRSKHVRGSVTSTQALLQDLIALFPSGSRPLS